MIRLNVRFTEQTNSSCGAPPKRPSSLKLETVEEEENEACSSTCQAVGGAAAAAFRAGSAG